MPPITHIKITAKHEPYRRAGIQHSRAGTTVALAGLSKKQLAVLQADPHLVVTDVVAIAVDKAAAEVIVEKIFAGRAAAQPAKDPPLAPLVKAAITEAIKAKAAKSAPKGKAK